MDTHSIYLYPFVRSNQDVFYSVYDPYLKQIAALGIELDAHIRQLHLKAAGINNIAGG